MRQNPKLTLSIGGKNLQINLRQGAWMIWCLATYPLAIAFGYFLFGWIGVVWVIGMQVFNFRGKV